MSLAAVFAALLLGSGPADCPRAANDQTPEAQHEVFCFVGWLYAPGVQDTLTPPGRDARRLFTADAVRDMDAARARAVDGAHPAFEVDPVCDCQDPGGLRMLSLVVPEFSEDRAVAEVWFDFGVGAEISPPETRRHQSLHLKKENGAWRIDDIATPEGWSFRAALTQD